MNRIPLICAATLLLCAASRAQPIAPPVVQRGLTEPAPIVDADAQQAIERMVARYAALRSYSDATELHLENAAGEPAKGDGWIGDMTFRGTLAWERPARIRFEGTTAKGKFLALGTPEISRVISPDHPNYYVARPRNPPVVATHNDGTRTTYPNTNPIRLEEPLMGDGTPSGPSLGFILEPEFWTRTLKDVRVLTMDADAEVGGEACRVVQMQLTLDEGSTSQIRIFIAKRDGLLRRMSLRDDQLPGGFTIVETHSEVRANPDLPASTWNFEAPADARPVEYFPASAEAADRLTPDLKIGALLPTFSGDAIDGNPLELNAKSGKVTVVYFFNIRGGIYSVPMLTRLQNLVGRDKLQIIGVSGDGVRSRVEEFNTKTSPSFPIYFDESAMLNPLAQKFGVKGWSQIFIFASDGKLVTICHIPGEVGFIQSIQKLLPGTPDDAFFVAPETMAGAE